MQERAPNKNSARAEILSECFSASIPARETIAEDRTRPRRFREALPLRHSAGIQPDFQSAFSNCGPTRRWQTTVEMILCSSPHRASGYDGDTVRQHKKARE